MIEIKEGDILNVDNGIIIQQVNCMGVMGLGLAKSIREKYPVVYKNYAMHCNKSKREGPHGRKYLLGDILPVEIHDNLFIFNIFSQYDYGREPKLYTDYDALRSGLEYTFFMSDFLLMDIAIPYGIGCGHGGGDWEGVVFPMIKDIFADSEHAVTIYRRQEDE